MKNPKVPALFHSDFDNFDQYISNVKGGGPIHTAHGFILQEVESTNMSPVDRTKERSIQLSVNIDFSECFLTKRKSPVNGIEDGTALTLSNTVTIFFASFYVVYVNLSRYFQVTLASYRWSMTLLNFW